MVKSFVVAYEAADLVPSREWQPTARRLPGQVIPPMRIAMTPDTEHTRDDLPDGRNGHVVGENDDNVLESIGKAIVAPIAGADEGAEPVDPAHGRAFVDLTKTLPQ